MQWNKILISILQLISLFSFWVKIKKKILMLIHITAILYITVIKNI